MDAASTPAARNAPSTASRCPAAPGAANPRLSAPSLVTAEPRITACTVSPSASARASGLRRTAAAPLPPTVPSAAASKARTAPVGERVEPFTGTCPLTCGRCSAAEPTSIRSASPARSAWQARCTATRELEQAVDTVSAGPVRPSRKAARAATKSG